MLQLLQTGGSVGFAFLVYLEVRELRKFVQDVLLKTARAPSTRTRAGDTHSPSEKEHR